MLIYSTSKHFILVIFLSVFFIPSYADHWGSSSPPTGSGIWIPETEYVGFYDENHLYTVVGVVKNTETFPVIPIIKIMVQDGDNLIQENYVHANTMPNRDIPFRISLPEVKGDNPILLKPETFYVPGENRDLGIQVLYDNTLIKHEDGHLTGTIINKGNETLYDISILALVHDKNNVVLDMAQNFEQIKVIHPNEKISFSMYPDKSISGKIFYYSCFAPSEGTVKMYSVVRAEGKYILRFDSGAWIAYPEFNEKGTEMTVTMKNSFPIPTYVNFELPPFGNEKFDVTLNGKSVKYIQSLDEMNNSHVALNIEPYSSGTIKIKGFNEGYTLQAREFPAWFRDTAGWWSYDGITDVPFTAGIKFLIEEGFIITDIKDFESLKYPLWLKHTAKWWSENQISDDEFTNTIAYLLKKGYIEIQS